MSTAEPSAFKRPSDPLLRVADTTYLHRYQTAASDQNRVEAAANPIVGNCDSISSAAFMPFTPSLPHPEMGPSFQELF
jgi:hypothetical protein